MMHGHEKSGPAVVAVKPTNKAERFAAGAGGAKGGDQGECGPATHAPDSAPHSVSKMLARIRQHIVAVDTQGGNRMRESCTYGSVRGARGNSRPYRDPFPGFLSGRDDGTLRLSIFHQADRPGRSTDQSAIRDLPAGHRLHGRKSHGFHRLADGAERKCNWP